MGSFHTRTIHGRSGTVSSSIPGTSRWAGAGVVAIGPFCRLAALFGRPYDGCMAVGARPLVPSRLAPMRLARNGIAHGSRRTPTTLIGGYVALTKPRIIELLLVTTVPTMVLAERGWPSWSLVAITLVGGTLAAGG